MDFQNVNPLNIRLNKVSGNLLPMTADDISFPLLWKFYSVLVWLLEVLQIGTLVPGCLAVPREKALKDGLIGLAITLEVVFIVTRIHARRGLIQQLVRELNDIMKLDDEMMRNVVKTTIKSMDVPLKFCWSSGVVGIILWSSPPYVLFFQKDSFSYVDYKMPVVYTEEPVSKTIFLLGTIVVTTSSTYIFTKKICLDTYMINIVLLVTAQYRYTSKKLSAIFREGILENDDSTYYGKKHHRKIDQNAEKQIRALCRHHNAVIHVTLMLKDLLSLNFSLIYINNVLRFCAIGIMVLKIPSMSLVEGSAIIMYACGGLVQLYILCFCVQQFLDATIEITDKAFHDQWYQYGASIKHIFIMMIMLNNLDCKLSRFEKFNLSLPSFMAILNQSYSIALLLLKTS